MDAIHCSSGYYADGKEFNPERFLNDSKTMTASSNGKFSERDHFNFGWGRRLCPGIYLVSASHQSVHFKLLNFFFFQNRLKLKYLMHSSTFLQRPQSNLSMRMERPLSLISLEQEQAALLHCLFHLM
jgi:cytochrome P450